MFKISGVSLTGRALHFTDWLSSFRLVFTKVVGTTGAPTKVVQTTGAPTKVVQTTGAPAPLCIFTLFPADRNIKVANR